MEDLGCRKDKKELECEVVAFPVGLTNYLSLIKRNSPHTVP